MESGTGRPRRRPGSPAAPDPARGRGGSGPREYPAQMRDPGGGLGARREREVTTRPDKGEARYLRGLQRTDKHPPPKLGSQDK